jgi:1-acyl-sn-glycerol-3-phosphate acyltransferase
MGRTTPSDRRVPEVGPEVPRSGGVIPRAIGHGFLALTGWRIAGELPDLRRFVLVVGPHTSNWDFVLGVAVKWALRLDARFIGKHTLFRGPLGPVMRGLGGIPVNRHESRGLVARMAAVFSESERLVVAIAPEGTRSGDGTWRSGFYRIAEAAHVPVVPVALDHLGRAVRIGAALVPSGDYAADLAILQRFVQGPRTPS